MRATVDRPPFSAISRRNSGNARGPKILISLARTGKMASIVPGELSTVTFTELPVQGGRLYEIVFALGGTDDDPTDDRDSFQFFRNADE